METYKKMLACLLSYGRTRKRVVICDEPASVALWIGALSYTFPLASCAGLAFSTYEYDPDYTVSRICGVIPECTKYSYQASSQSQHVFDAFLRGEPEIELPPGAEEYLGFVEIGMSFAYEALEQFHSFVQPRSGVLETDESWYGAYALYILVMDGVEQSSEQTVKLASEHVRQHGNNEAKAEFASKIANDPNLLNLDSSKFIFVATAAFEHYGLMDARAKRALLNAAVEKVAEKLSEGDKQGFETLSGAIGRLLSKVGISLSAELMKDSFKERLVYAARRGGQAWQGAYGASVICGYAKDSRLPAGELAANGSAGRLLFEIVPEVFKADRFAASSTIFGILDEFSSDMERLPVMAFNFESMLKGLPRSAELVDSVWNRVLAVFARSDDSIRRIISTLIERKRYDLLPRLFSEASAGKSPVASERLLDLFLSFRDLSFLASCQAKLLELHFRKIAELDSTEADEAVKRLMKRVIRGNIQVEFSKGLAEKILSFYPWFELSREELRSLNEIWDYMSRVARKNPPPKLVALYVGDLLSNVSSIQQLREAFRKAESILRSAPINFDSASDKELNSYLSWALQGLMSFGDSCEDLSAVFRLFGTYGNIGGYYLDVCSAWWRKAHRADKTNKAEVELAGFLLSCGADRDREAFGKSLSSKGKRDLDELDAAIKRRFAQDPRILRDWEAALELGKKTNAILHGIGSIFKRKQ
jgi:hypothetical protein